MKSCIPLVVAASLLVGLSSCAGDTQGVVFTSRGVLVQTADNTRADVCAHIGEEIKPLLGDHWRPLIAISEKPTWSEGRTESDIGRFTWERGCTVSIALVGNGLAEAPLSASVSAIAHTILTARIERSSTRAVLVSAAVDRLRFAYLTGGPLPASEPSTASSTSAPVTIVQAWPKSYTIQQGDTLADISTAFYGSTQHWRVILDANPGLQPDQLRVGQVLSIPKLK